MTWNDYVQGTVWLYNVVSVNIVNEFQDDMVHLMPLRSVCIPFHIVVISEKEKLN